MSRRSFRLEAVVGSGAFGEVYRATNLETGEELALKLLHPEWSLNRDVAAALVQEGRVLAALDHPSMLKYRGMAWIQGCLGLFTEFVDGVSLSKFGQVSERSAVDIIQALAHGLADGRRTLGPSHAPLELVHQDIKPANIVITPNAEVKLIDFGLAYTRESGEQIMGGGTPAFLPPEKFRGEAGDASADVYALGVVLFSMLSGERYVRPEDRQARKRFVTDERAYRAWSRCRITGIKDVPAPRLERLLSRMLSWRPEDRPTVGEVAAELAELRPQTRGNSLARACAIRRWHTEPCAGSRVLQEDTTPPSFVANHPEVWSAPDPESQALAS